MESVQFMQFDKEGNLYVYEPGAGCSGVPRKIEQGFTEEQLSLTSSTCYETQISQSWEKFPKLEPENVHKLVPKYGLISMETCKSQRLMS